MDCFQIALQNCGNDRVKFTHGGQMKRRKSRTHALDIPSGMQRNLSESQLVQVGSKAVSNVAEQFSKLGHSLNPKILTGKKTTPANDNVVPASEELQSKYAIKMMHDDNICDIDEFNVNETTGLAEPSSKFNDNSFLQGVGIVMVDAAEMAETQSQTETRKSTNNKKLENVTHISISSVTENVKLPPEMLNINNIQPGAPEINIRETEDSKTERNNGMKMCHSVADIKSSDSTFDEDCARYSNHIFILNDDLINSNYLF